MIYLLSRLDHVYYDEMASCVVYAASEKEARKIAGEWAGGEDAAIWHSKASCESIGEKLSQEQVLPEMICRDFNAG